MTVATYEDGGRGGKPDGAEQSSALVEYRLGAKILHWLTVVLVLFMVTSGVIFKQFDGMFSETLYLLHKTLGPLTLMVVLLRLFYRVAFWGRAPEVQADGRPTIHYVLYGALILVPLAGWAGVSDFGSRTILFGYSLLAIWPEGAGYADLLLQLHAYLAFALLALVALHIGIAMQDYMTRDRKASAQPK
jgi:cytochrome b561